MSAYQSKDSACFPSPELSPLRPYEDEIAENLGAMATFAETCPRECRIPLADGAEPLLRSNGIVECRLADETELQLRTRQFGDSDGWPIILLHGTPGSSLGPRPKSLFLQGAGIRLITFSRPGYEDSTRHEERIFADAATYVEAIARAYGLSKFSVAGRSGGGPSALACAALLPDLVVNAAVFSTIAPAETGMRLATSQAAFDSGILTPEGRARVEQIFAHDAIATRKDLGAILRSIADEMSPSDQNYIDLFSDLKKLIAQSQAAGLSRGMTGRLDDALCFAFPWGFSLRAIRQPVWLIQGEDDNFTLPWNSDRMRLALRDARDEYSSLSNVGHMETLAYAPRIFLELRNNGRQTTGRS